MVDLVGSTRMVETLVEALGPSRAAEALGGLLNHVFTALVDRIHAQGGTVIHFGGDALTAWFPSHDQGAAVRSALEIQEFLSRDAPPRFGDHSLRVEARTTLCHGEVLRCVVGDPGIQRMDVLAGGLMTRLARMNARTPPGEVCVDRAFRTLIGTMNAQLEAMGGEGSEGMWKVVAVPAPGDSGVREPVPRKEVLEARNEPSTEWEASEGERWVHPAIEARLRSFGGALLDEMREVTILFLHFEGIDYDRDPEAEGRLDRLVRFVQGVFSRYEGVLLQVIPGDKGDYLYGCFGAPVAHEDDIDRGLLAALEMSRPPPEIGLAGPPSIGVARGLSYAGAYGSPVRRTYGVLGREVIRAARLMERAGPGEVLVPEILARRAPEFQVESRGEVRLKGFEAPVSLVRVTGRVSGLKAVSVRGGEPLEGREEDLRLLTKHLDASAQRLEGGLVILEGPPGMGKTRLVMEVADIARRRAMRVLWGAGEALGVESPYHAWRPVFEEVVRRASTPGEDLRSVLERLVVRAGYRPGWGALLDVLFPFPRSDDADVATMSPEVRANHTRLLLAALLRQDLGGEPALVVLEDLHWFDQTSLRLLLEVRSRIPEALFLAVSRPLEAGTEAFSEVIRAATSRVSLGPLGADGVVSMACRRLGAERLHPDLRRWIVRNTEGNPLMVREMALNLRETGLVEVRAGVASIVGGDPEVLPREAPSLREVLISRVDRLEPMARTLLKVASVAGGAFPEGILGPALGAEGPRFLDGEWIRRTLDDLVEAEFLVPQAGTADRVFAFHHVLTREAVYGTLLEGQRRRIHEAMARWWEAQEEIRRPPPEVMAWHWQEAGDPGRALDYLDLAAERALQRFANDVAASLFARALALLGEESPDRLRRARLELGLGIARVNLLRFSEAIENLVRGLDLLGCSMPGSRAMQGLALAVEAVRHAVLRLLGRWTESASEDRRERMRMVVRALERLSELYYIQAEPTAAYLAGFRMINWAIRAGPSPEAARAHASFGAGVGFIPLHWAAPYYFERARTLMQRYEDPATENYVCFMEGFYRLGTGAFEETERLLRRSLELSTHLGDERRQADALSQLVPLHVFRGEVPEARRLADQMVTISRDRDYLRNLAEALYLRAWTAAIAGEIERALEDNEELWELLLASPRTEDPFLALGVRATRAYLEMFRGESDLAVYWMGEAMTRARGYQPNFASALQAFCVFGDLWYRLWRRGLREFPKGDLRTAVSLARTFARVFPVGRSGALRVEGEVAWIRGDRRTAHRRLTQAAEVARRMGMVLEEAHALLSLIETLPPEAPEREWALERVRVLLQGREGLGALRWRLRAVEVAEGVVDDR